MKHIREQLGLTQELMANYLGVSRALLSHYEDDRRSIPSSALKKVAFLEILLIKPESWSMTEEGKEELLKLSAVEHKRITKLTRQYLIKKMNVESALEKMEKKYQAAHRMLEITGNLLAECEVDTRRGAMDKIAIELMENCALDAMNINNRAEQLLLREKLKAYNAIIKALEEDAELK